MVEQLQQMCLQEGYQKLQTNVPEVTGFCRRVQQQWHCICLIDDREGFLNAYGKQDHLIRQMAHFVEEQTNAPVACLGVVVTADLERVRRNVSGQAAFWVVDLAGNRLIRYEDQPRDFYEVEQWLETLLYEREWSGSADPSGASTLKKQPVSEKEWRRSTDPFREHGREERGSQRKKASLTTPYRQDGRIRAFHFTPVNTTLVILNVLIFVFLEWIGDTEDPAYMYVWGGMTVESVLAAGQYWRLLSCAFLHFGFSHLFNNMLVLAFAGDNLERELGSIRYLLFYLIAAVGSSLISCICMWIGREQYVVSAGASGAIFAVLGGIFYVLLQNHGRKEDLSVWRVGGFLFFSIWQGIHSVTTNNSAHISGLLLGVVLAVLFSHNRKSRQERRFF